MGDYEVHGGISIINFTAGERRENNSVAFGKETVGNELLGNAFFPGLMPIARYKEASRLVEKGHSLKNQ